MSEHTADSARFELAKLRALGVGRTSLPVGSAARRAGRTVVRAGSGSGALEILSWVEGLEPEAVSEHTPSAKSFETLVFTACLGACWQERGEHPWPGVPAPEDQVFRALIDERGITSVESYSGRIRRVLTSLRETAWLDGALDTVRLGPRVAAWTENDAAVLRTVYTKLPRCPRGTEASS